MTDRPENPDQPPAYGSPPPPAPPYGSAPDADPGQLPYGPQYGSAPPPPYGSPQYGSAPPPAYGAPPYPTGTPEQSALRTQAIVSLVINALVVLFSCFAALPSIGGAITAGIAIGQAQSDPENARRLVRWSWGLLIASIVIGILIVVFFVILIVIGANATPSDPTFDSDFS